MLSVDLMMSARHIFEALAMINRDKTQKTQFVFVYGTLKRGQANDHLLDDAMFIGPATTDADEFTLFDLGAFPALYPMKGGPRVWGELYQLSDDDTTTLRRLDRLEGEGRLYERVTVPVTYAGVEGTPVTAWTYLILTQPSEIAHAIPSGEWEGYR